MLAWIIAAPSALAYLIGVVTVGRAWFNHEQGEYPDSISDRYYIGDGWIAVAIGMLWPVLAVVGLIAVPFVVPWYLITQPARHRIRSNERKSKTAALERSLGMVDQVSSMHGGFIGRPSSYPRY